MTEYGAVLDFPLFTNDRHTGNQPTKQGSFEVTTALLKEMVEAKKRGEQPILQIACWDNTSKAGLEYIGCKLSMDGFKMTKALEDQNGGVLPEDAESEDDSAEEINDEGLFD